MSLLLPEKVMSTIYYCCNLNFYYSIFTIIQYEYNDSAIQATEKCKKDLMLCLYYEIILQK